MPKRKQPETSQEASDKKTSDSKNRDYDKIIAALKVIGTGHYEEIANFIQVKDLNVVSRRLSELRKMNLLVNTGLKRGTSRGCKAFVHALSESQPKTDAQVAVAVKIKPSLKSQANTHEIITQPELF